MADVRSGIETGEDESALDVNSDAGFNARLAAKVAGEEGISDEAKAAIASLSENDTDVQGGLTYGEESPPRDGQGRFAPKEPVAEPGEEGAAPADEDEREPAEEDPWAVQYREAEKLIGRQGNELGELRQALQEEREARLKLEGRVEATPAAAPVQFDREQLEERISGPNGDGSGGEAAWEWAANVGDRDLLESVAEIWGEYQPFHAARRWNDFERYLSEYEREAQAPEAPAPDPRLQRIVAERQFGEAFSSARAEVGLADEAQWNVVKEHVNDALTSARPRVLKMIDSSDPQEQQEGIEIILDTAKSRAIAQGVKQVADEVQAEKVASKKAASIATGSLRPAKEREPASPEVSREDAIKRFKTSILEAETASVADGLTYGS
jgi:hypothetical protein